MHTDDDPLVDESLNHENRVGLVGRPPARNHPLDDVQAGGAGRVGFESHAVVTQDQPTGTRRRAQLHEQFLRRLQQRRVAAQRGESIGIRSGTQGTRSSGRRGRGGTRCRRKRWRRGRVALLLKRCDCATALAIAHRCDHHRRSDSSSRRRRCGEHGAREHSFLFALPLTFQGRGPQSSRMVLDAAG